MPSVPRLTVPEVTASVPGAPRLERATPEEFGAIEAQENARIGTGLLSGGLTTMDVVISLQEKEDAASVLEHEAALKQFTVDQIAAARDLHGQDSLGMTQRLMKDWDAKYQEIAAKLSSDRQRRLFRERTINVRASHVNNLSAMETERRDKYLLASVEANIRTSIDLAAANPHDRSLSLQVRGDVARQAEFLAGKFGWSKEQKEAFLTDQITKLHEQVIQALAVEDPMQASRYYEEVKAEIAGSKRDELGALAEKASAAAKADAVAGEVWLQLGPKGLDDPLDLQKMNQAVREKLPAATDKAAQDLAISMISQRAHEFSVSRKEYADRSEAVVNLKIAQGRITSISQLMRDPDAMKLPGDKVRSLADYLRRQAEHAAYMAIADENRRAQHLANLERERNLRGLPTMLALQDPKELMRLSEAEVINLGPVIGYDNAQKLLDRWRMYSQHLDRLEKDQVFHEDVIAVAAEFGYDWAKPQSMSHAQREMMAQVVSAANTLVAGEARERFDALSRDEKKDRIRSIFADLVMKPVRFWPDSEKPYAFLTPEERRRAYVRVPEMHITDPETGQSIRVPAQDVIYAEIPPHEEAKIRELLRQAGIHRPTRAQIAQQWALRRHLAANPLKAGK